MKAKTISNTELKTFLESDDFSHIVQKNQERYKRKWEKWANKKENINLDTTCSWNWAAFFFQEIWLLYRKMNVLFWLFLGLRITITLISFIVPSLDSIANNALLGLAVVCGMYGNTWYLKQCMTLSQNAKAKFSHIEDVATQGAEKQVFFSVKGGVFIKGVFAYLSVMIVLFAILFFVIMREQDKNSITVVQSGIFEFDETMYLGDALEGYAYFKNPTWQEISTPQGRKLVRFSAEYDFIKEAKITNQIDFYDEFPTTSVLVVLDFALHPDNNLFEIYAWNLIINGESFMNGDGDFAYDIIANVIYPNNTLNIPIYIEMRSGN